jgi:repressor LexA
MISALGSYLKRQRETAGISTRELSRRSGISYSYIAQLERAPDLSTGKLTSPTVETLQKLATGLGLPFHEFMQGAGFIKTPGTTTNLPAESVYVDDINRQEPPLSTAKASNAGQRYDPTKKPIFVPLKEVPLAGQIRAGISAFAEEDIEYWLSVDGKSDADFALRVKGDSMINAGIFEGDLVICKKTGMAQPGEIVVAIVNGDEATLKYLVYEDGVWKLRAANPRYHDVILNEKEDRIIGVVNSIQSSIRHAQAVNPEVKKMMAYLPKLSPKKQKILFELIELMKGEDD